MTRRRKTGVPGQNHQQIAYQEMPHSDGGQFQTYRRLQHTLEHWWQVFAGKTDLLRPKIHRYTAYKRPGFVKPGSVKLAMDHLLQGEAVP